MALLEIYGLTKTFGKNQAVVDLDLMVEKGQIRGLIGPNGSGKTTVFNLISGLLQPTSGKIIWQGQDITHLPSHKVARLGLARTFQLTAFYSEMTALENVIMCSHLQTGTTIWQQVWRNAKTKRKETLVENRALDILERMGILDIAHERAGDLPHGHAAALGIANALAIEPQLILLDEPVGGMNPTETAETMERIKSLRDDGITVFLVEHDMKAVMTTCDEITCINFGNKIAEGLPHEVCTHPVVMEAYLGGEVAECFL